MNAFFILAGLLLLQSLWSLRGGFQFLRLLRRRLTRPLFDYCPPAAVIIPCKGLGEDLERNAPLFLAQSYPSYQVIFSVATEADAAYRYLIRLTEKQARMTGNARARLVVAGLSDTNGEKVNNLLAGVEAVEPGTQVLAFADIDATPARDWLRALTGALGDSSVIASTGFRWYLPGAGFASRVRAAWDSSIATMMGNHDHNFAWGGSMAIRAEDFKRLRVAEKYWRGTVSDDYAMTRAVRDAGGRIRFEPRCLVASSGGVSFGEFVQWANRQIIITRVYHARYWKLGLASYGLYAATLAWGIALIALPGAPAPRAVAAAILALILALGMSKGALRSRAARELFPEQSDLLAQYGGCYWKLAPVIPWIMLLNFTAAAFTRRIRWQGTVYELRSMTELKVLQREAPDR